MVTDKRPFRLQGNLIENNLRVGIAGFLIGACLSLAVVFLFFIGKTVLTTRDMTRTYSAENYYILLDDFFRVYYLNPAAAVDMILVETEYNPNQLDQAEGLTQIALAYRMMGYEQKALDTYQRILDSMQDCLYRNAYSDRQAFILAHAILAADNLKESLLADQLYVRLKGQVASTLDEIQDSKSVSDSYWYLIKTVSRREGTLAAREYFQQMQNRIEPQL
jgi:tetratricopeptide (TPR) repeat protein